MGGMVRCWNRISIVEKVSCGTEVMPDRMQYISNYA